MSNIEDIVVDYNRLGMMPITINSTGSVETFKDPTYEKFRDLEKRLMIMDLEILKLTNNVGDKQYKSILSMLASPDEKDQEMARLSILTLKTEVL